MDLRDDFERRLFDRSYILNITTRCWNWTGTLNRRGGYGQCNFLRDGKRLLAHRWSWLLARGPIPDGLHVLHRCDNPRCVNPEHLFLGTHQDNMRDAILKGRRKHPSPPRVRGEKHGRAKLNAEQVKAIRLDDRTSGAVAKDYGMSPSTIHEIRERRIWRHVP
jgi:hypothetical protein